MVRAISNTVLAYGIMFQAKWASLNADTHFTIPSVRVCSRINTSDRGEIRTWVLSHHIQARRPAEAREISQPLSCESNA